jgi:hypothetical protein
MNNFINYSILFMINILKKKTELFFLILCLKLQIKSPH